MEAQPLLNRTGEVLIDITIVFGPREEIIINNGGGFGGTTIIE